MYTVFYSLEIPHRTSLGIPEHKAYTHRVFQHLKGYKPKVAVSTICPVGFEALQSFVVTCSLRSHYMLLVVTCFKSPNGYNFTTVKILNFSLATVLKMASKLTQHIDILVPEREVKAVDCALQAFVQNCDWTCTTSTFCSLASTI